VLHVLSPRLDERDGGILSVAEPSDLDGLPRTRVTSADARPTSFALADDDDGSPVHNELHGTDLVMEDFRYYRPF
jgi:hypothetical protein